MTTPALADLLGRRQVMDIGIRPLWGAPRLEGPAFTVRCAPGDNLMLHAAIHQAPRGAVVVVESGDLDYALAGGNVCAVAQRNGIAGFVLDGVIRDLVELRALQFPVYARGVIPIPGTKQSWSPLNEPVTCGGVLVSPGDLVVADEEGIVVVPEGTQEQVMADAVARQYKDEAETLDHWEAAHRTKIEAILVGLGAPPLPPRR